MNERDQHNLNILATWIVAHLPMIADDGHIIVPDNSPLDIEDIVDVLRAVAVHDDYHGQTVSVPDRNGRRAVLSDGKIEKLPWRDKPHPQVLPPGSGFGIRKSEDE